jgi:hypothetical protein
MEIQVYKEVTNETLHNLFIDYAMCIHPYLALDDKWLDSYSHLQIGVVYRDANNKLAPISWINVGTNHKLGLPSRAYISNQIKPGETLSQLESLQLAMMRAVDMPFDRDLLLFNMTLDVCPKGLKLITEQMTPEHKVCSTF